MIWRLLRRMHQGALADSCRTWVSPSNFLFTARIRRMGKVLFSQVSVPFTWRYSSPRLFPRLWSHVISGGGGYPMTEGYPPARTVLGYPPGQDRTGVPPWPGQEWGTPLARTGLGYPPARTGMGYPPPHQPRRASRASTC